MMMVMTAIRSSKTLFCVFSLLLTFALGGCVTVLDAATDEPIRRDPGKRTFGGYIDDKQIKTIVSVNLKKADPRLSDANVSVTVYNGLVLLTGQVPTKDLREKAGRVAREVNKVRQVYNELQILPNTAFLSRTNDSWLATKVNTKLMAHQDIDSGRVVVVVENSTVYLMGLMTRIQAEKITDVARSTSGVSKVVRAIEYID
jgi:osmotically-inducible protein OsmY